MLNMLHSLQSLNKPFKHFKFYYPFKKISQIFHFMALNLLKSWFLMSGQICLMQNLKFSRYHISFYLVYDNFIDMTINQLCNAYWYHDKLLFYIVILRTILLRWFYLRYFWFWFKNFLYYFGSEQNSGYPIHNFEIIEQ